MFMLHTMFRREFAALPGLVRVVPAGDAGRAGVVADHLDFITGVLEGHHRAEDAVMWPKLLERGRDEVAPVVHTMEGHHAQIEELSSRVVASVRAWRRDASLSSRDALAGVLDELIELLYRHMSLEELSALPLAEKYMTTGEWVEMAHHSGAGMPPGKMSLIFGMTLYEADPSVMEETLSNLPAEVRATLQEEGIRAYAEYASRIHGTATPRRSGPLQP
jgi:hypothetical protein